MPFEDIQNISSASNALNTEFGHESADYEIIYDDHIITASNSDSFDIESLYSGPGSMEVSEMDLYGPGISEGSFKFNAVSPAAEIPTDYVNAIRLDCTIDGDDCTLLLPPEYIDRIFIDGSGRLWNLSASTISGRIVDDVFNPYVTTGDLVYLTACLGNNFQSIYNNGSPNYVRSYYWSSNRLSYTDNYTEIIVNDYHYPFYASDIWNYAIVFLLFTGVILSWLRNFKHY